jgi:hypothetical protein
MADRPVASGGPSPGTRARRRPDPVLSAPRCRWIRPPVLDYGERPVYRRHPPCLSGAWRRARNRGLCAPLRYGAGPPSADSMPARMNSLGGSGAVARAAGQPADIRTLEQADLPQASALFERVMNVGAGRPRSATAEFLERTLLTPRKDPEPPRASGPDTDEAEFRSSRPRRARIGASTARCWGDMRYRRHGLDPDGSSPDPARERSPSSILRQAQRRDLTSGGPVQGSISIEGLGDRPLTPSPATAIGGQLVRRALTLRFDEFGWERLESEAQRDGEALDDLLSRAAAHFYAERSMGRAATLAFALKPGARRMPREIRVEADAACWKGLESEARRQGIPLERLLEHAALLCIADIDSGRLATRVLDRAEEADEP